jgi:hypothetical protein
MLFDRPASLPIATMRSSSRVATFRSRLRGARSNGWRWVRPRLVPATVAIVGMLAVLGSAEYLTHLARYTPEQPTVVVEQQVARVDNAPSPGVLLIEQGPPGAMILLDGNPIGRMIQLPANPVQLELVPDRQ